MSESHGLAAGMRDMTRALNRLIETPAPSQDQEASELTELQRAVSPITADERSADSSAAEDSVTAPIPFHANESEEWRHHEDAHDAYLQSRSGCDE